MAPLTPSANWAKPPPVSPSCPHSQGSRPPGTWKSSVAIGWSSLQAPETELCPNRLLTFKSVFLKHTYYNVISCCTPINSSLRLLPMKNGLHDLPPILLSAALLLSLLQAGVTTGNHAICILLKLSKLSQSVQTNKQTTMEWAYLCDSYLYPKPTESPGLSSRSDSNTTSCLNLSSTT